PITLQYPFALTKFIFNPSLSVNFGFLVLRTQEIALVLLFFIGLAFNRVAAYHIHSYEEEENRTRAVSYQTLRKVIDRQMARIIYLLSLKVLAPQEITAVTGIPLREVYRRLYTLVYLGIVEVKGIRYIRGRKIQFFGVVPGRVYIRNGAVYLITP
ncbi:MAG: hypothetical protein QXS83_04185, partial [Thermoplasmata archaeon]